MIAADHASSADPAQAAAFAQAFADGIGWGDAKQQLFERIDSELSPLRERYNALMAEPEKIEALLRRRGQQLREQFSGCLCLRCLRALQTPSADAASAGRREMR